MNLINLSAALLLLGFTITACGGGGGGGGSPEPSKPTSAELLLGTALIPADNMLTADITFPLPSQYSITGVTLAASGTSTVTSLPGAVRIFASIPSGVPIGTNYATVQLAVQNGSTPVATQFQPASSATFWNVSTGNVMTGVSPSFTITNVR